jgi:hypothetical protein
MSMRGTLWLADDRRCHYCRTEIALSVVTIDHIVPRAFNGPSARWNMVSSCKPCNERLADSVRKCSCKKCKQALNRFHVAKRRRPVKPHIPVGDPAPRTWTELLTLLRARRENMRRRLHLVEDRDTLDAAALGGKIRAYTELLDLIDGIDTSRWEDALTQVIEADLGPQGLAKARALYKASKFR